MSQLTVVNSVVTGRVEDPLKWAYLIDDFCVQPELIEQVHLVMYQIQ